MPKRSSIHKAPQDESQLAKSIVDELTIDVDEQEARPEKNAAAVALGKLGGLKGGKARAEKLSDKRKKEIARDAARARWDKKKQETKD